uniref:BRCT domain-containing protein n=1 Tax=Strongyloides papillosus TaxID=174720 RepID=A0A0N5C0B6_STREA
MIRKESYFYIAVSGFASQMTVEKLGKYLEEQELSFTQIQTFPITGTFKIIDYSEDNLNRIQNYLYNLGGQLTMEEETFYFFFSEMKEIKILLEEDASMVELMEYFTFQNLPMPEIIKAGEGLFYLYNSNPVEVLILDFHLQIINGTMEIPSTHRRLNFIKNDQIVLNSMAQCAPMYYQASRENTIEEEEEVSRIANEIIAKINEIERQMNNNEEREVPIERPITIRPLQNNEGEMILSTFNIPAHIAEDGPGRRQLELQKQLEINV